MARFKDWLVFSRTHTAALTIPGVLLAAYIADPYQSITRYALFGLLALLSHASGFQVNNLFDLPWDRMDPSKAHHPLVSGAIAVRPAWFNTLLLSYAAFALGAYLSLGHWMGIVFMFAFTLFGTLYNYYSKKSFLAPILISLSFASLPLYAWYASGGSWNLVIAFIAIFSFILLFGQIAVSGYVKELAQEGEVNLLRRMGCYAKPTSQPGIFEYYFPEGAQYFALSIRASLAMLAIFTVPVIKAEPIILIVFAIASLLAFMVVVRNETCKRSQKVKFMGMAEVLGYWLLVVTLYPILGWAMTLAFGVAPLAWYLGMNRVMWGTAGVPAV